MNSIEERAMDLLPRVKAVGAARASWTINVVWSDGTKNRVDLTGLIHRSRHFYIVRDHPSDFRKVRIAPFGAGIEWENGLDYGADTLKMMADEQRPVTGADLVRFESNFSLSTSETAALLGMAERTVRAYRRAKRLPQSVSIAIRTIAASNTVLAAHYRPAGQRGRGRPKKRAPAAILSEAVGSPRRMAKPRIEKREPIKVPARRSG
jgi:Protein of unknown function (DUF2442)